MLHILLYATSCQLLQMPFKLHALNCKLDFLTEMCNLITLL